MRFAMPETTQPLIPIMRTHCTIRTHSAIDSDGCQSGRIQIREALNVLLYPVTGFLGKEGWDTRVTRQGLVQKLSFKSDHFDKLIEGNLSVGGEGGSRAALVGGGKVGS